MEDLHCGLDDMSRETKTQEAMLKKYCMEDLVQRASVGVKEVAAEFDLPLAADKEDSIILRERREKGRRGFGEKVKWLGVIFDKSLTFELHWKMRIEKVRALIGALREVGGSRWGMSPDSWQVA